jgi:hypothetical protein
MSEIAGIQELDGSVYLASIRDDDEELTEIRVSVSRNVMERLGTAAGDERRVVQDTLAFLLDRQHADELPDTLDLEDVVAAYDDYLEDMRRRAAGSRAD